MLAASSAGVIKSYSWYHIVLTRTTANLYSIYVNGALVASGTNTTSMTANTTIGYHRSSATSYMYGYLANFRSTNSLVYSGSFMPPAAPLTAITNTILLTCQSNRFVDNSASSFTLTANGSPSVQRFSPFNPTSAYSTATIGGSGYFDGSGDYLKPNMATSDF